MITLEEKWVEVAKVENIPVNGGACIQYQDKQIALFYSESLDEWYACQNLCPHKKQMVLSRGLLGDHAGEPKVACPLHKNSFSLKSGKCLTNEDLDRLTIYPVKVENNSIYIAMD